MFVSAVPRPETLCMVARGLGVSSLEQEKKTLYSLHPDAKETGKSKLPLK